MRHIGEITGNKSAHVLSDYLYVNDIDNKIETKNNVEWEIWILDDDDIPKAQIHFEEFTADPNSPKFSKLKKLAKHKRDVEDQENAEYSKRINIAEKNFAGRHKFLLQKLLYMREETSIKSRLNQFIKIFIIICGIVYLLSRFGG